MAGPNLADVKKLLDDGAVGDDIKRKLLLAFVATDPFSRDALQPYVDRLGMVPIGLPPIVAPPFGDLDKVMQEAERQRDKAQAEDGRRALADGASGAASSNTILDQGAGGLRYFEYFAPLYQRCVSGTEISRDKACELYDEQRDINLAALRADGDTVTKAATKLGSEIVDQRNSWNTIDQIWTGQGAEAANAYVVGYLGQARSAQAQVQKFAVVLSPAADALEHAVRDKARAVAEMYADTVGGKTHDQIDEIISYAQRSHNILSGIPATISILRMFGANVSPSFKELVLAGGPFGPVGGLMDAGHQASKLIDRAEEYAKTFIERTFRPSVEARWRQLVDTCAATDHSVHEIYDKIIAAVNDITAHPFTAHPFTATTTALPAIQAHPAKERPGSGDSPPQADDGRRSSPPTGLTQQAAAPTPVTPTPATPTPATPTSAIPTPGFPTGAMPTPTSGVAWVRDPSQLPQGWTIDPTTGELSPPTTGVASMATSPASSTPLPGLLTDGSVDHRGGGPVEVHSAAAQALLDHDGVGDLGDTEQYEYSAESSDTVPGARPSGVSVSASSSGSGVDIAVSDATGQQTHYLVSVGDDGQPQLVSSGAALDSSGEVRAASAIGWSDSADGAGESVVTAPSAADPVALAPGGAAGGAGLGALWGADGTRAPLPLPVDQWLLNGDDDGRDAGWESLESSLPSAAGAGSSSVWLGPAGEGGR